MAALSAADTDWVGAAATLRMPSGPVIDGAARPTVSGATRPIISPRDGSTLTHLPWADAADVDVAVAAARRAFDSGPWPRLHPRERGEILVEVSRAIEAHRAQIALLVSLEMGKPIQAAYDIELRALIRTLRYYGELADKGAGEVTASSVGELALVTREPAGVVAAVVPWNFPLTLGGWKLAPALAVGCTVVLKMAEQSPLSMLRVAEIAVEAGLPPGVLNVLTGDGVTVGSALGRHPDVDVLTFTGSTEVGRHFLRYSADSNLKRVYLELGGKSPNIVFPDAPDLDEAADMAAWAIFFNSGQMCTGGSRLVLHQDIADDVLDRVVSRASAWAPGDPLLWSTRMGPVVDERSLTRLQRALADGVAAGATVRTGGSATLESTGGTYLEPTVVTGLAPDNVLVRDELFGPILSVLVARDEDDAVRLAGDTPYGLAAALWTSDLGRAHRVSRRLRAGTVWVNCYEEGDLNVPFGGVKLSGFGRDKSRHAMDEYTDLKTTWIKHG